MSVAHDQETEYLSSIHGLGLPRKKYPLQLLLEASLAYTEDALAMCDINIFGKDWYLKRTLSCEKRPLVSFIATFLCSLFTVWT